MHRDLKPKAGRRQVTGKHHTVGQKERCPLRKKSGKKPRRGAHVTEAQGRGVIRTRG